MKKRKISAADYAGEIIKALPRGILLTTKAGDKVNSMVIGWGTIGVNRGKPVFITYVRESRFTHELLEQNPEFTINVPKDVLRSQFITRKDLLPCSMCILLPSRQSR